MASRGTRPTQPRRWGRHAEALRLEAEQLALELVELARQARQTTNVYKQQMLLAQIEAAGERIARLMLQATQGDASDYAAERGT